MRPMHCSKIKVVLKDDMAETVAKLREHYAELKEYGTDGPKRVASLAACDFLDSFIPHMRAQMIEGIEAGDNSPRIVLDDIDWIANVFREFRNNATVLIEPDYEAEAQF